MLALVCLATAASLAQIPPQLVTDGGSVIIKHDPAAKVCTEDGQTERVCLTADETDESSILHGAMNRVNEKLTAQESRIASLENFVIRGAASDVSEFVGIGTVAASDTLTATVHITGCFRFSFVVDFVSAKVDGNPMEIQAYVKSPSTAALVDWEGPALKFKEVGDHHVSFAMDINSWTMAQNPCWADVQYAVSVTAQNTLEGVAAADDTFSEGYDDVEVVDLGRPLVSPTELSEQLEVIRAFSNDASPPECTSETEGRAAMAGDETYRYPVYCNGTAWVELTQVQPGATMTSPASDCGEAAFHQGHYEAGMYYISDGQGNVGLHRCDVDENDGAFKDFGGDGTTEATAGLTCESVSKFFGHEEGTLYIIHDGKPTKTYCTQGGEQSGDGLSEQRIGTDCQSIKKFYPDSVSTTNNRYLPAGMRICDFNANPAVAVPMGQDESEPVDSCASVATSYGTKATSGWYYTKSEGRIPCEMGTCTNLLKGDLKDTRAVIDACKGKAGSVYVGVHIHDGTTMEQSAASCSTIFSIYKSDTVLKDVYVHGEKVNCYKDTDGSSFALPSLDDHLVQNLEPSIFKKNGADFRGTSSTKGGNVVWEMRSSSTLATKDKIPTMYFPINGGGYIQRIGGANICIKEESTQVYWIKFHVQSRRWRTLFRNNNDHLGILYYWDQGLGMYCNRNGGFRRAGWGTPDPNKWYFVASVHTGTDYRTSGYKWYIGEAGHAPTYVGMTDRNPTGTCYYRFGWSGQAPGWLHKAKAYKKALTVEELKGVWLDTNPF